MPSPNLPASGRVELFAGAGDLLGQVARTASVVIVSNVFWRDGRSLRRDLLALGVAEHVSACVTSLDVGWRKPDVRIFQHALAAARAQPEQTAMVGDSEENDIAPAVALGMTAIRLAIAEPPPTAGAVSAARYVCTSFAELADVLSRL